MAEKWVEEARFGSGFYHGDLHAGNMMFAPTQSGPNGAMTVIDFGNSKVLEPHERQAIFKMMLTATLNDPKLFCENFESILSPEAKELMTPATREAFTQDIAKIMNENRDAPGKAIGKILDAANERYIEVPGPISNFSRSELMLENTLAAISEANAANWDSYRSKMENLPTETAKAQKSFDRCLTDFIQTAETTPGTSPQLLEQLKSIQTTPYIDLTDEQVATLLDQGDPLRNLTSRLGQMTQLASETLSDKPPESFSIDKAISNVLARHKGDALSLAGTGLAVRATAALAV
jgi:predicted unusual protein kinase regulating ubiquinone biosynthesis (AarF/ABC1/UbiB family)